MGSVISGLFGGGKVAGPDPSVLAAQKRQEDRILKKEKEEKLKLEGRQRVAAARGGRGQGLTLFKGTGERGVKETLGG